VKSTYWPHLANFERLSRSRLDWRLLCPGPMVDAPALGLERLRLSLDVLPVAAPAVGGTLSDASSLPVFASLIPQMIVPYADAAALMLPYLDRGHAMSRHRVGLALPAGMARARAAVELGAAVACRRLNAARGADRPMRLRRTRTGRHDRPREMRQRVTD
jgi:hypothetical protein